VLRELAGGQDLAPKLAGQLFDALGEIDGWTDTGEVEPIAAADIPLHHSADMQGETETHAIGSIDAVRRP